MQNDSHMSNTPATSTLTSTNTNMSTTHMSQTTPTVATSKVVLTHPMSKAFVASALTSEKVHVTFRSEPTPAAEHKGRKLVKVTSGIYASGINYADLPAVKQAIENGERGEVQSPSGAEWVIFPLVLRSLKTGKEQVRLTKTDAKPTTTYLVDDVAVSREHFESFLVRSARSGNKPASPVFNVNAENVISVVAV